MANVRVEVKYSGHSPEQQERSFKTAMTIFKRRVNELGILTEYKMKQTHESKGERKRRKIKEAAARRKKEIRDREELLKTKVREHFGQS